MGDGLLLGFWLGLAWEGVVMSRRRRPSMLSPQSIVCGVHHDHGIVCTVLRILGKVRVLEHLLGGGARASACAHSDARAQGRVGGGRARQGIRIFKDCA